MQCPNCGSQNPDGSAFCGSCGANLQATAAAAPQAQQPTQPLPTQQPTQQMPAPAQQYPPPGYTTHAPPQSSGSGGRTGLIVAVVVLSMLLLAGSAVGAFLLLTRDEPASEPVAQQSGSSSDDQQPGTDEQSGAGDRTSDQGGTTASSGSPASPPVDESYATALDAVLAVAPSGWVAELVVDEGARVEYWVGPPNSEYTDAYIVNQVATGDWIVTGIVPIGEPNDSSFYTLSGQEEAVATVSGFLDAIMEDRPLDAQSLTVEPFYSDPASAQYSDGDFYGYTFDGVDSYEDGTFRVYVIEEWAWGTEYFAYYVVPTELGYYISELEPY